MASCGEARTLEHVDLLNSRDGLDADLLERLLKLLVVNAGCLGLVRLLAPRRALAAMRAVKC